MMIHEITRGVIKNKLRKRKGRGESSGQGKTSGRGNKGAKARQGTYIKRGHEGGQTPIFRRFSKRGFSNFDFERRFHVVNLSDLAVFADGTLVDAAALHEAGLIPDMKLPAKILGDGELAKKLTISVGWFSKSAHDKIIAAGGTVQDAKGQAFAFPKPKKKFIPREPVKKPKIAEDVAPAATSTAVAAPATGPDAAKAPVESPKAE
jgi:large subunit ribosomal protein L15